MSMLSRRTRAQLVVLRTSMLELAEHRNVALRMLLVSRHATTPSAQRDFWLEFTWLDQEYRYAVRRLAQFCEARRGALVRAVESTNGA